MSRLLILTVEKAFLITGRGCVLTPGLPPSTKMKLAAGSTVRLVRPDGESFDSVIQGLDAIRNPRVRQLCLGDIEFCDGFIAEGLQLVARGSAGLLPQRGNGRGGRRLDLLGEGVMIDLDPGLRAQFVPDLANASTGALIEP